MGDEHTGISQRCVDAAADFSEFQQPAPSSSAATTHHSDNNYNNNNKN